MIAGVVGAVATSLDVAQMLLMSLVAAVSDVHVAPARLSARPQPTSCEGRVGARRDRRGRTRCPQTRWRVAPAQPHGRTLRTCRVPEAASEMDCGLGFLPHWLTRFPQQEHPQTDTRHTRSKQSSMHHRHRPVLRSTNKSHTRPLCPPQPPQAANNPMQPSSPR